MRYSGHEWFPCRYAWLPKAYAIVQDDPSGLSDDERAVAELGIGKNMVRALRFWATAMDVLRASKGGGYEATPFGDAVFGEGGHDPYLEDIRTLWLLHWNVSTAAPAIFAWDFMLNHWHRPEIVRSAVLPEFIREANSGERTYSDVTLRQHYDVFMQVYVAVQSTRAGAGEDHLDSPLVELGLFEQVGERTLEGRREPVYVFRQGPKPEVTPELFAYCLASYWAERQSGERTLSFRDAAIGKRGPGRILRLPEADVRRRLEGIGEASGGRLVYRESAAVPHVEWSESAGDSLNDIRTKLLDSVYEPVLA